MLSSHVGLAEMLKAAADSYRDSEVEKLVRVLEGVERRMDERDALAALHVSRKRRGKARRGGLADARRVAEDERVELGEIVRVRKALHVVRLLERPRPLQLARAAERPLAVAPPALVVVAEALREEEHLARTRVLRRLPRADNLFQRIEVHAVDLIVIPSGPGRRRSRRAANEHCASSHDLHFASPFLRPRNYTKSAEEP